MTVTRCAAGFSATVGIVVLFGWWIRSPLLTSIEPNLAPMKPNTALSFLAVSAAMFCAQGSKSKPWIRGAGLAASVFPILIGTLSLFEDAAHRDIGIDRVLFQNDLYSPGEGTPRRMSPYTSTNFVLLGTGLMFVIRRRNPSIAQTLAVVVLTSAYLSTLGYLYGVAFLYHLYATSRVSLYTAITFSVCSIGTLWAQADGGLVRKIDDDSLGGLLLRQALPPAILIPMLLGWARVEGQRRGLYGTETGIAILVTSTTLVMVVGIFLAANELTQREKERKAILRNLEDREELLHTLFDQVLEGILIFDENGAIERVNPAAARLFGYEAHELTGRRIFGLIPSLDVTRRNDRGQGSGVSREANALRKDGSAFVVDLSASDFRHQSRTLFTAVVRDLSERQHAHAIARRLAAIVDFSADAIFSSSPDGLVRTWNPAAEKLFGYSAADIVGRSAQLLVPPHRIPEFQDALARTALGERVILEDTERLRKDGETVLVTISISPLLGEDRAVVGVSGIVRDIGPRKKLEEKLRQSQKIEAIGQLAGGIAHDFNNLLTIINGYADLGLRNLPPTDRSYRALTQIKSAGARGATLTSQLLAFGRKQVLQPKVVDPNHVIESAQPLLSRLLKENIRFGLKLDRSIPRITVDAHQLEQVLLNLVINSRDAMPDGGNITLETSVVTVGDNGFPQNDLQPGQYVVIAVSDTGTGMDASVKARIFDPFFTTKPVGVGTGLGLSTAFGIVKQSRGHIAVYSEPGLGTTMRVYLPATEAPSEEQPPKPQPVSLQGTETVLLAEDDPALRAYASRVLTDYGYTVLEASSGREALTIAQARGREINLVATDVVMPDLGGPELVRLLRESVPEMRVLYISGYTANLKLQESLEDGRTGFLPKPFDPEQLGVKVRELFDMPQTQRTILVVDDQAVLVDLLKEVLAHEGYKVITARTGEEAIRVCEKESVSLMITDLVMPDRDGIETIRHVRRHHPEIKMIAMSGAFGGEFLEAARYFGVEGVLHKPISTEQLLTTVRKVLG